MNKLRLPRSCGLFPGNQERTPRHFQWGPTVQRSHRGSLCASGESSELRQQSFSAPKGVMPMQGTVRRASCPRSNVETPGETGGEIARGEARPERHEKSRPPREATSGASTPVTWRAFHRHHTKVGHSCHDMCCLSKEPIFMVRGFVWHKFINQLVSAAFPHVA